MSPIDVVANDEGFIVLCDDGTVFALAAATGKWTEVEPLPSSTQAEAVNERSGQAPAEEEHQRRSGARAATP